MSIPQKILIYIAFLAAAAGYSQTTLPSFFGDNMVLQQNETIAIWGSDSPNTKIEITAGWGAKSTVETTANGTWKTTLKTIKASFDTYTVVIKGSSTLTLKNVLLGEVWFCSGQSNMEMPMKGMKNSPINRSNEFILNSENPRIRLFNTERNWGMQAATDVKGSWQEAKPGSVSDFSAVGYLFAKKIHDLLNIPVGIIESSWGGTKIEAWIPKDSLSRYSFVKIPTNMPEKESGRKQSTFLYNGMIAPFKNLKIKGFLWYQGESNRMHPEHYKDLMHTLVGSWRAQWGDMRLPFYFVQIAPYGYAKHRDNPDIKAAMLREAQLLASQEIPNSGMVVTADVGDCDDIHPPEKELIANRLAYWALGQQYGFDSLQYQSPVYKAMKTEGQKIIISFDDKLKNNGNGLSSFGQTIKGFAIAGSNQIFYPATATLNKDKTITVSSEKVKKPVAVRYNFESCYKGNLFNTAKLPVSPFRTDKWND